MNSTFVDCLCRTTVGFELVSKTRRNPLAVMGWELISVYLMQFDPSEVFDYRGIWTCWGIPCM